MSYLLTAARRSTRAMFRQRDRSSRLTIVATLTVTLGASVAIAAVVHALWLKPLPFADPASLHVLWHVYPGLAVSQERIDVPGFDFYRRAETPFADLAAVTPARSVNVAADVSGDPAAARQVAITANFFRLFGVRPTHGRTFTTDDAQRGAPLVAVVSAAVWTRHFGDAPLSGQKLYIDAEAVTVVGVVPPTFQVLERTDIWRPLWLAPNMFAPNQIGNEFLTVFGRARRGTTREAMAASMARLTAAFRAEYPGAHTIDPRWHVAAEPLRDEMLGGVAPVVPLLIASVAVLVVVGFVNVTNLVLAQSVARRQEAAVKIAIGSTRARLVTDYAAEALVLCAVSTTLGLIFARTLLDATLGAVLGPADLEMPPWNQVSIDGAASAFAVAVAVLGGLICAVVPSWNGRGAPLLPALGGAGRSTLGRGQQRLLNGLVTLEVATASLLVVASGLLVESILRLSTVSPGFHAADVSAFELVLPRRRYPNEVSVRTLQARLIEQLGSAPGVASAGFVSALPFRRPAAGAVVEVEGRQGTPQAQPLQSTFLVTGGDYFSTLRIPVRRGRLFGSQDHTASPPVVVIDEAAARYFWPGSDPIGRRLNFTFENDTRGEPVWREVVGIVGHVRTQQLQASTDFQFYVPVDQVRARNVTYVVRGAGSVDVASAIAGAVRAVDPGLPLHDFQPMGSMIRESFSLLRAVVGVVTAFGSMAAVLTGIGVYGVISYLVALRRGEFGVKLALGASAGRIRGEVLQWAARLGAIGLLVAIPAALALSWSIRGLLFQVSPFNPVVQAGAAAVILVLVLVASYAPAAAAARIDPAQTLRQG